MKSISFFFFAWFLLLSTSIRAERVKVIMDQPILPVLTMKETNPVLRLELIKASPGECVVKELSFSLKGTTSLKDIEHIQLYAAGKNGRISTTAPLSEPLAPATTVVAKKSFSLQADTTIIWVSVKLKEQVNLANRISVACEKVVTTSGKAELISTRPIIGLRTGVAVRQYNQNSVHTSRIPALDTSKKGTLLAVYDARYENSRDLQGHIDIGLNRSFDGGKTWQPMQVVLDMKEWGGLPEKFNGVSDACVLVDDRTGDIYIAGLWMHGVLDGKTGRWVEGMKQDSTRWIHQWQAKGSQPGLWVKETCQFLITKSTDDGNTWSEPVNITAQTKRPEWWLYAPAPGHGITLKDGTLLFPTQGRDRDGLPFSNITYSKDGGKTWITSNPAYNDVTECMAVELTDGSVMLNMRDNRNSRSRNDKENGRRICVTTDLGNTWTEHPTSRKALIESTCMASLHRHNYTQKGEKKTMLLFCNPESRTGRDHMTLKVSYDDGQTWSATQKILLDEYVSFGYSCITSVDESTIGILYESSQAQMVYQQVKLTELL